MPVPVVQRNRTIYKEIRQYTKKIIQRYRIHLPVIFPRAFPLFALVIYYEIGMLPESELLVFSLKDFIFNLLFEDYMMYCVFYHVCRCHNKMYPRTLIPDLFCNFYQTAIHLHQSTLPGQTRVKVKALQHIHVSSHICSNKDNKKIGLI